MGHSKLALERGSKLVRVLGSKLALELGSKQELVRSKQVLVHSKQVLVRSKQVQGSSFWTASICEEGETLHRLLGQRRN